MHNEIIWMLIVQIEEFSFFKYLWNYHKVQNIFCYSRKFLLIILESIIPAWGNTFKFL